MNGYNVRSVRGHIDRVRANPELAERNPVVTGYWLGKSEARIEGEGFTLRTGGKNQPSSMKALLATLAGCDIEVIALNATLLGIKLESLTIEARGYFNVERLYGIEAGPPPGYDRITYAIRLKAPGATHDQLARLREAVERASPVGDSLSRAIPMTMEFQAE